jgi:hypothetical protein
MPSNKDAGRAFEYALVKAANDVLTSNGVSLTISKDGNYRNAELSFELYNDAEKSDYIKAATIAINHIVSLEPKLCYSTSSEDALQLQLMPDAAGKRGDVRDILLIRSTQGWEIGISAKNNHKAVKHSRLSGVNNFGISWLAISCSNKYFDTIKPIFQELRELRKKKVNWRDLENKNERFYVPILDAFRAELLNIDKNNADIPQKLIKYLIGNNDFYKVIKSKREVEILGFNINGGLNKAISGKPQKQIKYLKLPSRIIELVYKDNSTDTLLLSCDQGWQISFRIHSASSIVETSLKFDINLIGHPQTLYSHHIAY